jgi:hypothetical protein
VTSDRRLVDMAEVCFGPAASLPVVGNPGVRLRVDLPVPSNHWEIELEQRGMITVPFVAHVRDSQTRTRIASSDAPYNHS